MTRVLHAARPSDLDSHTFWLMEQSNNNVGDELILHIRDGAPISITRAQVSAILDALNFLGARARSCCLHSDALMRQRPSFAAHLLSLSRLPAAGGIASR